MAFFINIVNMIEHLPVKRATSVFNTMRVARTVPDTRLREAARAWRRRRRRAGYAVLTC